MTRRDPIRFLLQVEGTRPLSREAEVEDIRKIQLAAKLNAALEEKKTPTGRHARPTRAESKALAEAEAEAVPARERLVRANLRLVAHVVQQISHKRTTEDSLQDGVVGLLRAAELFEPERGNRFTTFAVFWIRAIVARGWRKAEGASNSLWAKDITYVSMSVPTVQNSVDEVGQSTKREVDEGHEGALLCTQIRARLMLLNEQLDPLQRAVLWSRLLGDGSGAVRTLQEIGEEFGLTRESVRQVEKRLKPILARWLNRFRDDAEDS